MGSWGSRYGRALFQPGQWGPKGKGPKGGAFGTLGPLGLFRSHFEWKALGPKWFKIASKLIVRGISGQPWIGTVPK